MQTARQSNQPPGGASSLQPVLPKKKRDSTSSYQTNPCPALTRTSQTKNPCQKRLSTRAQNQSNSSNNPQTRLYDSRKCPSSSKTTSAKECKSKPSNEQRKEDRETDTCGAAERERKRKERVRRNHKKKLQCRN